MPRHYHADYDSTAAADRLLLREGSRLTAGADAFHQLDPSEIAMGIEELDDEVDAINERGVLRAEVFSGFMEYLFADGPDPVVVQPRVEALYREYHPALALKMRGERRWGDAEAVSAVLRKHAGKLGAVRGDARSRGALSTWNRELERERDGVCIQRTIEGLLDLLAEERRTWKAVTAAAYCIAKALRPVLIAGMSLEDLAVLCGDEGGRATTCDRTKRLVNRRLEKAGAKGSQVHFQKAAGTVKKYADAQRGNSNRSKKQATNPKSNRSPKS